MIRLALALALTVLALPARALEIQDVTSPGGIRAWLVEDHSIPFTALEIRFEGGTALDAPGKRGAVNLMAALIEEGTGDLDAQAFANARDGLGAEMQFRAGQDSVAISARLLTESRDQAADLLARALAAPRFDPEAVERVRGQVLSNLRSDAKNPEVLAAQAFDRLAWGDHPYGTSGDGTEASVKALTRDDLVSAHQAALARDRVFVAAVGDIDAKALGKLLDRVLGDLPATGAAQPPRAEYRLKGGLTVVQNPTPQAVVVFGHEGIKRADPDYFAAHILNEILGGGRFTSRLMSELREKRGLTYGVGTYLASMDLGELVMGQFATQNATASQAVEVLRAEWARAAEGVSAEELAAAKTYLTGSYPLRFDGNGPIAAILVGMQMERLPIDYAETRNDKIEAVTLDDVARVARRLIRPEDLHIVVLGQPEGL